MASSCGSTPGSASSVHPAPLVPGSDSIVVSEGLTLSVPNVPEILPSSRENSMPPAARASSDRRADGHPEPGRTGIL